MLGPRARLVRLTATTLLVLALLWGTFWGDDDNFPFGPFRMYSTTSQLDGVVRAATTYLTLAGEERVEVTINPRNYGLRRAEVEGQLPGFIDDPSRLAHLAEAYERRHEGAEVEVVELVHELTDLEDGRPVGSSEKVLARWEP